MDNNELYNALSGIDEKYISRSEEFSDISSEFKREKAKRAGILSSVCGGTVIAAAALCLIGNGIFDKKPDLSNERSDVNFVADTTTANYVKNETDPPYTNVKSAVTDVKKSPNNESNEKSEESSVAEVIEETQVSSGDTYENEEVSDVSDISDNSPDDTTNAPDTKNCDEDKASPPTENYYFKAFTSAAPDSDDYGTDSLNSAEVIVSGSKYIQLEISEYEKYNISDTVSESDFGEFIGTVSEISDRPIVCENPCLSGAEVYYYAPDGSGSVIIVKKAEQCSIFVLQDTTAASDEINPVSEILFQIPTEAESEYEISE